MEIEFLKYESILLEVGVETYNLGRAPILHDTAGKALVTVKYLFNRYLLQLEDASLRRLEEYSDQLKAQVEL